MSIYFFNKKNISSLKKEQFINLMEWANKIVNQNSCFFSKNEALYDLIKIVMKPIQAEHIRNAYLTHEHHAIKEIDLYQDFLCSHSIVCEILANSTQHSNSASHHSLKLASDIILPTGWHPTSLVCNLGSIGKENRKCGKFKQDINHDVTLVLPMRIGFVKGGNHSIIQGVLSGNGEIYPKTVVDLSNKLNEVYFNGTHWIDTTSEQVIGEPRYPEFGWVWEISKLLTNNIK